MEWNWYKHEFFGFDGGVSVNPGGVDARSKGVKLFFTVDDGDFDWFIKLESLAIDIILPSGADPKDAAVIIKGFLSIKDPVIPSGTTEPLLSILKNSTEYAGSVYVSLPDVFLFQGSNLLITWNNQDYDKRVEIQNILFPEGIRYNRKKQLYRTDRINTLFSVNTLFYDNYKDKKKSGKLIINENSASVPPTRLADDLFWAFSKKKNTKNKLSA